MEHQFEQSRPHRPVFCNCCGEYIWGLAVSLNCKVCEAFPIHKSCLINVPKNCSGKKSLTSKSTSSTGESKASLTDENSKFGPRDLRKSQDLTGKVLISSQPAQPAQPPEEETKEPKLQIDTIDLSPSSSARRWKSQLDKFKKDHPESSTNATPSDSISDSLSELTQGFPMTQALSSDVSQEYRKYKDAPSQAQPEPLKEPKQDKSRTVSRDESKSSKVVDDRVMIIERTDSTDTRKTMGYTTSRDNLATSSDNPSRSKSGNLSTSSKSIFDRLRSSDKKKEEMSIISQLDLLLARGNHKKVKKIITKESSKSNRNDFFNQVDQYGQNILHLCVDKFPQMIKFLVEKKIDINKVDMRGWSPLAYAAMKGDENVFAELLSLGATPDQKVMHYFCSHFCSLNSEMLLKTMITRGVDVNARAPNGETPLHSAALNSRENVVENIASGSLFMTEILIKHGSKANVTNPRNETPLHYAVHTDRIKVAKKLLMSNGNLYLQDQDGNSPLDLALKKYPSSVTTKFLVKAHEAFELLKPLKFSSEQPFEQVYNRFIEEELGFESFKRLNLDQIQQLAKNAANIAELLSAQQVMKAKEKSEPTDDMRRNTVVPSSVGESNNVLRMASWIETTPCSLEVAKKMRNPLIMSRDPHLVDDKHRLQLRLDHYKMRKRNLRHVTSSRGLLQSFSNNLFIAFADQLFDTIERADELRESTKNWLKTNGDFTLKPSNVTLKSLLPKKFTWESYLEWLNDESSWGDPFAVVALCEVYGCKAFIISSVYGSEYFVQYAPAELKSKRTVLLSHLRELYFDSLTQVVENPLVFSWIDETPIKKSDLTFDKKIGEGSGGEIFSAKWKGIQVAVKRIYRNLFDGDTFDRFRTEVNLLKKFRHPNIIMYMGMCSDEGDLLLVTEYMELGSLKGLLKMKKLDWMTKLNMCHDIASGMAYLHSLTPRVIHRDLKSSNILVDKNLNVKVSDFGVARHFEQQEQFLKTFCSTLAWTAPEIFNAEGYTEKVDVYSFGIVLWEIFTQQHPYSNKSEPEIIMGVAQMGLRPQIPNEIPVEFATLMKMCWSETPDNRPDFDDILVELKAMIDHSRALEKLETRKLNPSNSQPSATNTATSASFLLKTDSKGSAITEISTYSSTSAPGKQTSTYSMESSDESSNTNTNKTLSDNSSIPTASPSLDTSVFWKIDYQEISYDEKDVVGKGRSSKVFKGKYRGQNVAVKVLRETPDAQHLIEFQKELEVYYKVRCPNIVFFYGASFSPKCCIVTELVERGTLLTIMRSAQPFGWREVIHYSREVCKGMSFLHSGKPPIVHRDLKPSNLLVDKNDTVKICDLGLSRIVSHTDYTLYKCKSTPEYSAPEVYYSEIYYGQKKANPSMTGELVVDDAEVPSALTKGFTTKSDVFSFSIVLWEMVHRAFHGEHKRPYYSDNKDLTDAAILIQVAKKGLRCAIRSEVPASLSALIQWCWVENPSKRPTFDTILAQLDAIETEFNQSAFKWNKLLQTPKPSDSSSSLLSSNSGATERRYTMI